MSSSTFIRLAGPLQSWAGSAVTGNFVRTESVPTESALKGLLAAALGSKRGQWPAWIDDVQFTVREDRQPSFTSDFHTIGSREDEFEFRRRLAIMQQIKASSMKQLSFKPAVGGTSISRRTYLIDAEFIVRVTCEGHTEEIDTAFAEPKFSVYLGKKAFPASFPFYLGTGNSALLDEIPVMTTTEKETSNATVRVYHPALGLGATPHTQWAPAQSTRAEWLKALSDLNLAKRSTALKK